MEPACVPGCSWFCRPGSGFKRVMVLRSGSGLKRYEQRCEPLAVLLQ